jgi:hypothetical protein
MKERSNLTLFWQKRRHDNDPKKQGPPTFVTVGLLPFLYSGQFLHPLGSDLESVLSSGSMCDRPAALADFRSHQPGQGVTHVSSAPAPQSEGQAGP